MAAPLAGCAAMAGYPAPAVDPKLEQAELAPFVGPAAIERYEACADKTACRNMIIDARVRAVDIAFNRFERRIYSQEGRVNLGSEVLSLGLDSVGAVTGTKALAAGAGLLTGSRDAYEKQVLNVSLPLLFEEMIANRREVLVRIRQGQTLPVANYTLFQALDDVGDYEEAGSLPAAAAALATSAGATARSAEAKLEGLRAARMANSAANTATASPVVPAPPTTTTTPSVSGIPPAAGLPASPTASGSALPAPSPSPTSSTTPYKVL